MKKAKSKAPTFPCYQGQKSSQKKTQQKNKRKTKEKKRLECVSTQKPGKRTPPRLPHGPHEAHLKCGPPTHDGPLKPGPERPISGEGWRPSGGAGDIIGERVAALPSTLSPSPSLSLSLASASPPLGGEAVAERAASSSIPQVHPLSPSLLAASFVFLLMLHPLICAGGGGGILSRTGVVGNLGI